MAINLHLPPKNEALKPTITVFGVGGAGGNAVNNMITSNLQGVNFVVANTDAQALERSACDRRLQLGVNATRGLGAGASPQVGADAAEEVADEISDYIAGSNMVFITAGMGGGTGTGAAPVIARLAREQNVLTVGVVTKPFHFEGRHRMRIADYGLEELQKYVDTLIIVPNQNLFRIANEHTTFADAFKMADEVLHSGVRGVTDLMIMPGLINLDFADVRAVMSEMGKAMMGTGEATGAKRAIEAAEAAISNPLLDDVSMKGAKGVLINITGGLDMTLFEVDEAANRISSEVDADANIIFGSTFNEEMEGRMRVSVVATGIDAAELAERNNGNGQKTAAPAVAAPAARSNAPRADLNRAEPGAGRFQFPVSSAKPREQVAAAPVEAREAPVAAPAVAQAPSFNIAAAPAVEAEPVFVAAHAAAAPVPRFTSRAAVAEAAQAELPILTVPVVDEVEEEAAAPAFIPPRAELPSQRGHYGHATEEAPRAARASRRDAEEEEESKRTPGLFQRLAGMASGKAEREEAAPATRRVEVTETKKPDIRDTRAATGTEENYLDIPAFLRRQAN
ncbi:MAG: cell division protein FtsZ [Alphaproteobacteria bacterium]|nr:cell division protein FtsZ [Alphaproteobacteria bacterium]